MKRKLELAATNTVSSTMSTSDNGIALQDKKAKAEQTKGPTQSEAKSTHNIVTHQADSTMIPQAHVTPQTSRTRPSLCSLPTVLLCEVLTFIHDLSDRESIELTCRFLNHCSKLKASWGTSLSILDLNTIDHERGFVEQRHPFTDKTFVEVFRRYHKRTHEIKFDQIVVNMQNWIQYPYCTALSLEAGKVFQNMRVKHLSLSSMRTFNAYAFLSQLKTLNGIERLEVDDYQYFRTVGKHFPLVGPHLSSLTSFKCNGLSQADFALLLSSSGGTLRHLTISLRAIENFDCLIHLSSLETLHVEEFQHERNAQRDQPFTCFAKILKHLSNLQSLSILQEKVAYSQDLFEAFPHLVESLIPHSRMQSLVLRWGTQNIVDWERANPERSFLPSRYFLTEDMMNALAEMKQLTHLEFACYDTKITGSFLQGFAKTNSLKTLTLHAMTSLSYLEYKENKEHPDFKEYKALPDTALLRTTNVVLCDPMATTYLSNMTALVNLDLVITLTPTVNIEKLSALVNLKSVRLVCIEHDSTRRSTCQWLSSLPSSLESLYLSFIPASLVNIGLDSIAQYQRMEGWAKTENRPNQLPYRDIATIIPLLVHLSRLSNLTLWASGTVTSEHFKSLSTLPLLSLSLFCDYQIMPPLVLDSSTASVSSFLRVLSKLRSFDIDSKAFEAFPFQRWQFNLVRKKNGWKPLEEEVLHIRGRGGASYPVLIYHHHFPSRYFH